MVSLNVLSMQYLPLSAAPTAYIRLRPAIMLVSLLTFTYNKIINVLLINKIINVLLITISVITVITVILNPVNV